MLSVFLQVIRRDLLLAMRQKSDVLNTLFFFVVVVTMVPLGIGPEPALLRDIAAGVVWVAALLAAILSLPRLFANDYADGTLEQMLLSAEPLSLIVLGVVFDLDVNETLVLVVSLALGTPVLSLIGAIGAALTLGLRGGGVLTSLLVLPLYIPVLIFGAGSVGAAASGLGVTAYFLLLGAFALSAAVLTPWVVAIALRISVE